MDEFPSNSHKDKAPAPQEPVMAVETIDVGTVIRKKKGLGKRIAETFFGGGDARTVWSHVAREVLFPATRDMLYDGGQEAMQRIIYGEDSPGVPGRRAGRSIGAKGSSLLGHFNYQGVSTGGSTIRKPDPRASIMSEKARATHNFDEIIFDSRVRATEVLDQLYILLQRYDFVTVGALYRIIGEKSYHTDEKFGWESLQGSGVTRTRQGYLLNLPTPQELE